MKFTMKSVFLVFAFLNSARAQSQIPLSKEIPVDQARWMEQYNNFLSLFEPLDETVEIKYRPYADYEKVGFLLMSSDFNFDSRQAKLEMAKNLPADAFLVIFADNAKPSTKSKIISDYKGAISADRIKVIELLDARSGFWARDGMPVPVFDDKNKFTVIDAKYYHNFEPDQQVSGIFKAALDSHAYYYEGGNFQPNDKGDCLMVNNNRHAKIPDSVFQQKYGCKNLIRLPLISGIGHVDEHARFIDAKTVVTDLIEYKEILEKAGFKVAMLPRPENFYETYVNSLIMNDRVVVPVYGQDTDAEALEVYRRLGLKASGGDATELSNVGLGAIHCITMTYPKLPFEILLESLGAQEIH